jgi:hypothetical protein
MRGRHARALFACIGVLGALGAVGALLACGPFQRYAPGMAPNPTPPAIRTSGFHLLPDLPGVVESPPFQQNGGGYQILMQQIVPDSHFDMRVSWLDGTGRRDIALKYPCDSETAVSADGMWLACLANGATSAANNPTYYLETASLSASGPPHHAAIRLDAATDYRLPVWSPDGAYLALVRSPHKDGACSVQIFAVSSDHSSATLRTTLTSEDPPTCAVTRLGWSSDGARLLILAYAPVKPDANGNVARGPLLADIQVTVGALLQAGTSAATIPIADFTSVGRLQGFGNYDARFHPYAWNPVSGALALMTGDSFQDWTPPSQIVVYTPGQRETQTLFTMPYRGFPLLSLNWSSDGWSLLVGVGGTTCGECGLGVQNWYLYTPGDQ